MNNRPHFAGKSIRAFSLLELLLVLVIVMLLFGAAVFEFNSMNRGVYLSEGTDRLKSLFRFASNEAQRTGKLVRVRFGATTSDTSTNAMQTASLSEKQLPIAEWEPAPIKLPGQFKKLPNSETYSSDIDELVSIESVLLTGLDAQTALILANNTEITSEQTTTEAEDAQSTEYSMPLIYFYQDGSCDSAKVQLASKNLNNLNKSIVELIGFTGNVRHHIIEFQPNNLNTTNSNEGIKNNSQPNKTISSP
jgi:type II secretory pathway pseudopilin PulG